MVMALGAAK